MKINRLFEIIYLLLEKRTITAKELAAHFEVSVRTIYRDIDILASASIPIYFQRGKHGGIKLMDNYIMNKSLLSQKEQNEILYALQSLNATNYFNNDKTLSKLSAIFNQKADNWIKIDFSRYNNDDDNTLFEKLKEAILTKQTVKFDYFNTKGKHSERTADPLTLWFKEKAWYLFAYCHKNHNWNRQITSIPCLWWIFWREYKQNGKWKFWNYNGISWKWMGLWLSFILWRTFESERTRENKENFVWKNCKNEEKLYLKIIVILILIF